jgi:hypothetical protein
MDWALRVVALPARRAEARARDVASSFMREME